MKLFVTGLCGSLGRALAREATSDGHRVVGINRGPWPDGEPMPTGTELVRCAMDDGLSIRDALVGCDALVHGAGLHQNNAGSADLAAFVHTNVELTAALLDQAYAAGIRRVVLCSSMTVQIGRKWDMMGACVVDESMPARVSHHYSVSKWMLERLGEAFCRTHPDVSLASLRHMAFGAGDDGNPANLIARFLSCRDAARACLSALSVDGLRGEVFNIGSGSRLSNADICEAQIDPRAVVDRVWPGAMAILNREGYEVTSENFWPVASNAKSRATLGYEPIDTFEAWLVSKGWRRPS